ncbi:hypothetical protein BC938DRAFT_474116 [Jimgerdemannia flammicorona]|uniref:RNA methyltransferase n=1 Tax=Jimgerdemannia flammicorona TaxID=994334 RepID=A0A433QSU9_9FUNG|nr:hypothetical protein BC938DRAFT_474116 [Jimgerdemannia flammicorona]
MDLLQQATPSLSWDLIGDDHAMGYGDWAMLGNPAGLAHKLPQLFPKEATLRQRWIVLSRGRWHTTTEEWLPESESKEKIKPRILSAMMNEPKIQTAEIFVIIVGSEDVRTKTITPKQSLHNIQAICAYILKCSTIAKPPTIFIASIPTAGDDQLLNEAQIKANEERNRLIEEWLSNPPANVLAGPKIDLTNFEYDRADIYCKDKRHFNTHGYHRVAKDILLAIKSEMVKREFGVFKAELGLDYEDEGATECNLHQLRASTTTALRHRAVMTDSMEPDELVEPATSNPATVPKENPYLARLTAARPQKPRRRFPPVSKPKEPKEEAETEMTGTQETEGSQRSGDMQTGDEEVNWEKDEPREARSEGVRKRVWEELEKFPYGNYRSYYSSRRKTESLNDMRVPLLQKEWFEGKSVLDIGCNSGQFTVEIALRFSPRLITGVDIDGDLINMAHQTLRLQHSLLVPPSKRPAVFAHDDDHLFQYFPRSIPLMFGKIPVDWMSEKGAAAHDGLPRFPTNVKFRVSGDWTTEEVDETGVYDAVFALSITKWIHLHGADDGIKAFFHKIHRVLKPGGRFVLEPQEWETYRRRSKWSEVCQLLFCFYSFAVVAQIDKDRELFDPDKFASSPYRSLQHRRWRNATAAYNSFPGIFLTTCAPTLGSPRSLIWAG